VKLAISACVTVLLLHAAAWAADGRPLPNSDARTTDAARAADKPSPEVFRALEQRLSGLGGPSQKQAILPELKGVVSWQTLAQVSLIKQKDRIVPDFAKEVAALDKKEVRLQGFMLPLDVGDKQKRFLLTATPPSCGFCMPGGPEQVVEVTTKVGIKVSQDPVVLAGRLVLVRDDPSGLYYRLIEAIAK
jgi:uncharacterized protein